MWCPITPLTLSVLLEHQLPLLRLILVLTTPPVLSSFTCGREENIITLEKPRPIRGFKWPMVRLLLRVALYPT